MNLRLPLRLHPAAGPEHEAAGRVPAVHRLGAVAVALVVLTFGLLGFAGGLDFFSTSGEPILGMSSNGLLSTISVVTAAVLITAAMRGPRIASTVMIAVGSLFLLSGLANLAVLRTSFNVLAFELANVYFSFAAGLTLLLLGAYGRISGHLPADSPYARAEGGTRSRPSPTRRRRPSSPPSARCGRRRSPWSIAWPRPTSGAGSRPWRTSARERADGGCGWGSTGSGDLRAPT